MQEYELCQVPNYKVNYENSKKILKPINVVSQLLNHDYQMHERLHKGDILKLSVDIDKMTQHNPSITFDKIINNICDFLRRLRIF